MLGAGVLGVLYTMWLVERRHPRGGSGPHHTRVVQLHHRYGMIMFIASEVMFFVAWFWAYFDAALYPDRAASSTCATELLGAWPPKGIETFDPWHLPLLNTLILLTSGTTVTWAHHALLEDDRKGVKQGLWLTVVLGVLFTDLPGLRVQPRRLRLLGPHLRRHLLHGDGVPRLPRRHRHDLPRRLPAAAPIGASSRRTQHLGFEFAAWYWHFVDVVWLFLFAAIYVWGSRGRAGRRTDAAARTIPHEGRRGRPFRFQRPCS